MDSELIEDFVDAFVAQHFPKASPEDKRSLQASAFMYLYEEKDFKSDADDLIKLKAKLAQDLKDDFSVSAWREVKVDDLRRTREYGSTAEDVLSKLTEASRSDSLKELKNEIKQTGMIFDQDRETFQKLLPPVLFEAFIRLLEPEIEPHWTAGFSDETIKILCWRAVERLRAQP